ncbi:MAG TPA: class I SAM-dependent methyltransferase [Streptosporangiaceae bacterium]|jgi:ubiquinone/menaquinone biosynthesis C-methylase UbiE|nr:class I SAM-dependent methyltransferase [Streptosporangiaceae bacterium]
MSDLGSRQVAASGQDTDRRYLPAAGIGWLLPLYDPLTRLIGVGAAHRELANQAELGSARRVLEIGCGTGNLALLVRRMYPDLEVIGLDPDPRALSRARRKARSAGLALQLDRGFADQLPYPDCSFDRVLSSLMFHHLDADLRVASLREFLRVLRPQGSLHLMDFGGERHHLHGLTRLARRSHTLQDNWDDRIPALLRAAGFSQIAETGHLTKHVGRLTCYRAGRG